MQLKRSLLATGVKASTWLAGLLMVMLGVLPNPNLAAAQQFAYVTNQDSGTVSVIDLATGEVVNSGVTTAGDPTGGGPIAVGMQPYEIAITPDGKFAYVANAGEGTVSVIETQSGAVAATVAVGVFPGGVAITPDGAYVYVTNLNSQSVSVIRTFDNSVMTTISLGTFPLGIAIAPAGDYVYVTDGVMGTVSVIHTATNLEVAGPITVGAFPYGIAIDPKRPFAYVTNLNDDTITVINTASNTVVGNAIPTESSPVDIAVSPDGTFAYVTNLNAGSVSVLDTLSNTVVGVPILVGTDPYGVAFSADGKLAYVANSGSHTVSVIDTDTHTVVGAPIFVGQTPYGVAFTPPVATEPPPEPEPDPEPVPEPPAVIPFAAFDIDKGWVRLYRKAGRDQFVVKGHLESSSDGDGIDLSNEDVTVTFGDYSETIPAGSFVRYEHNQDNADHHRGYRFFYRHYRFQGGYSFQGEIGGLIKVLIRDDGRFMVKAWGLDLGQMDRTSPPVAFSLQIGDDLGKAEIPFRMDRRGRRGWFHQRKGHHHDH